MTLNTSEYTLWGPIQYVWTTEPPGSVTTRNVTLRMGLVREDIAEAIRPDMTEQSGSVAVAEVTGVEVEPSLIIATGDNGSVNVVDHPISRELMITTELRVRETTSGVQFNSQSLRQGLTVVIDLGTIIVRATVVSVGT